MKASNAVDLFGTDEPAAERRLLAAGALTAVLEDGNLREIRFGGVEIIRAINYLARDTSWGTYKPDISNLAVNERPDHFEVSYDASCGDAANRLTYRMSIKGQADGNLAVAADAHALTDFATNRTGFVVLHPSDVAGKPLIVGHGDGTVEETMFPLLIMADQPGFDIVSLSHEAAPGLRCTLALEGDAFEMEDQRNWSDASFKTYVRPLSKPRPYVIAKGGMDRQSVAIRVEGVAEAEAEPSPQQAQLTLGPAIGSMPQVPLFIDETVPAGDCSLSPGIARQVIIRLDLASDADSFAATVSSAQRAGAAIAIELVLDCRDPQAEASAALAHIAAAGVMPAALLLSPRRDFKTRPSNQVPDGEVPVGAMVDAIRGAGYRGLIGAGTPSNFTEFNRNPPGPECDFAFFSVAAIVHAADEQSVIETLEVYPAILDSARALCPGKPIWLGPCTIGTRHNPYGAAPAANPHNRRVPAAQTDPRQNALFGAAFATALVSVTQGVDVLTLTAPAGPFGLVRNDGSKRPVWHVQQLLAQAAGCARLAVELEGAGLHAVAWLADGKRKCLIANLNARSIELSMPSEFLRAERLTPANGLKQVDVDRGRLMLDAFTTLLLAP